MRLTREELEEERRASRARRPVDPKKVDTRLFVDGARPEKQRVPYLDRQSGLVPRTPPCP